MTCSANNNAGLGPTAVLLHLSQGDPWVYGALVSNVWSVTRSRSPSYNKRLPPAQSLALIR